MKKGPNKGKLRIIVETKEEREILDKARTYFGDANTLIKKGLGVTLKSKRCSSAYFRALKNGCGKRYATSLAPNQWEEIKRYAKLSDEGKRYPGVVILPEV